MIPIRFRTAPLFFRSGTEWRPIDITKQITYIYIILRLKIKMYILSSHKRGLNTTHCAKLEDRSMTKLRHRAVRGHIYGAVPMFDSKSALIVIFIY